jgi:plastocyanin
MRSLFVSSLFVGLALVACGGGDDDGATIDAAPGIDAPPLMATEVSCTGVTGPVIMTNGFNYSPMTTNITPGTVVKFSMPLDHNALSNDGLFTADFNTDTCVEFQSAGTFRFHCVPHAFIGTVVSAP